MQVLLVKKIFFLAGKGEMSMIMDETHLSSVGGRERRLYRSRSGVSAGLYSTSWAREVVRPCRGGDTRNAVHIIS